MKRNLGTRLRSVATVLHNGSIIHRWLGINDGVKVLHDIPTAMFAYNQRALFFGSSGLFLILLSLLVIDLPHDIKIGRTLWALWSAWGAGVVITIALHAYFLKRLRLWAASESTKRLPLLFGPYFVVDFLVVFAMILAGQRLNLGLGMFAFVLVANTVVYSAYIAGGRGFNFTLTLFLFVLLVLTFVLFPTTGILFTNEEPRRFYLTLSLGPLLGMLLVTVLSVTMISWLRANEHQITRLQLDLLGKYERILAGNVTKQSGGRRSRPEYGFSEHQFRQQVREVLVDLCSRGRISWYRSACLWFETDHQDRGKLLIPEVHINFDEAKTNKHGISATRGFLSSSELILLSSMKYRTTYLNVVPRFRGDLDAPAAFIPITRHDLRIGVLAIYGVEGGPPAQRQERAFLGSLGSIISNTLEQWEGRFKSQPQREMNQLFKHRSLDEVFREVVGILQKYLMATGCKVIFRPDRDSEEMHVVAKEGFLDEITEIKYKVGVGRTGECASKGISIRYDDVQEHRAEFDAPLLEALERAHERPIVSWMAIPIGPKEDNYGVIKVVNSTYPFEWFTDEDQKLGEELALRLHVVIEKFLHIKGMEDAKREAELQANQAKRSAAEASKAAAEASQARVQAERAARQRQIDLMSMTHQLQGPLNPVIGALSGLQLMNLRKDVQDEIEYSKALAESCLALCWGTSASFAKEAGRTPSFVPDEIDAPEEMKRLQKMLEMTNADNNLNFRYKEDEGFPKLIMDPGVFTSVMFSLIHNTLKYSDDYSEVWLECTFERKTGEAALKVKSEGIPIDPSETERIFGQFERGQALRNTALRHSGTGLGLWVARKLMQSIGGNLTVELSDKNPRLSVFVVHLPPKVPEELISMQTDGPDLHSPVRKKTGNLDLIPI